MPLSIMKTRMQSTVSNVLVLSLLLCYVSCEDNDFLVDYDIIINSFTADETGLAVWDVSNTGAVFNCSLFENPRVGPPSSVHELTPYDIKVVGALGDSITAAFGAKSHKIEMVEFRGISWSIGGDETLETVGTLPNIIKEYNPNVRGFSVGIGDSSSSNSSNNVAVSGGIAQDMPGQARILVDKIKADQNVDYDNDWKVVTLFIGGNNLCVYCLNKIDHSVNNYYKNIRDALNILHSELPKTFVNLVLIMDVAVMAALKTTPTCRFVHAIACPCEGRGGTSEAAIRYQKAVQYLAASGRYEKNDFTVVIQPLFVEMEIPTKDDNSGEPDHSYFAPDCFHFSSKGHKEAAVALWNNMVQPFGFKQKKWEINGTIICPTEATPYFYTAVNSPPVPINSNQAEVKSDINNNRAEINSDKANINQNQAGRSSIQANVNINLPVAHHENSNVNSNQADINRYQPRHQGNDNQHGHQNDNPANANMYSANGNQANENMYPANDNRYETDHVNSNNQAKLPHHGNSHW